MNLSKTIASLLIAAVPFPAVAAVPVGDGGAIKTPPDQPEITTAGSPGDEPDKEAEYVYISDIRGLIPIERQAEISLHFGIDYSGGDYGDFDRTELFYVPLSVKYAKGPWSFRATSGYITLSGPNSIIPGAGVAAQSDFVNDSRTGDGDSGIGDLYLSGTYSVENLEQQNIYLDLTARVKLPTGNRNKGLSTGKTDVSFQLDVARLYGDVLPFATIGYRFVGKSARFNLQNTWYASLGFSYYRTERLSLGMSYDFRKSATIDAVNPRELQIFADYQISEDWAVYLYGAAGLSDGSPDQAAGFHFRYSF